MEGERKDNEDLRLRTELHVVALGCAVEGPRPRLGAAPVSSATYLGRSDLARWWSEVVLSLKRAAGLCHGTRVTVKVATGA